MDNSIHNDEQIVQRQVIKKYNGARPWQVAVLMLMSAAVAALVLFVALLGGNGRYRLIDGGAKYDSSLISTLLSEIDKYYYFHDDAPDTEKLLEDAAHDIVNSIMKFLSLTRLVILMQRIIRMRNTRRLKTQSTAATRASVYCLA